MFTEYTGNRQFDLQLNRYLGPILDRPGMDRLTTSTLARIRSTSQITQFAGRMAARFDAEGDAAAAWRLYFLAAFYLPEHDLSHSPGNAPTHDPLQRWLTDGDPLAG